jgi:hypothetical protein
MPDFVLNRDHTLRSVYGHIINFHKGEPAYVPPHVVKEAVGIGAEPVESMDKTSAVLGDEQGAQAAELMPLERTAALKAAFPAVLTRNARNDFTAGGQPTVKAMARDVGFEPDSKELTNAWLEYKQEKALAE